MVGPCDAIGEYDIPVQRFDETMQQLAHATGCNIRFVKEQQLGDAHLLSLPVAAVRGRMSLRQACLTALKGSAFELVREKDNTLYIKLRK